MRRPWHLWGILIALALILNGCGYPGVPLPPELQLPTAVSDLRATRKGDTVSLTWSVPTLTTEHQTIRHYGPTLVCRSLDLSNTACGNPVGEVAPPSRSELQIKTSAARPQAHFTDKVPPGIQQANPIGQLVYAVSVLNSNDRSAGLSNRVQVPAAPTLSPPQDVHAQVTAKGIVLAWSPVSAPASDPSLQFFYRIYRHQEDAKGDTVAGQLPLDSPETELLDHSFEWQKTYSYRIAVVTLVSAPGTPEVQVEGDDSNIATVEAKDIFPPAVPSGLQAVASGVGQPPFIDLIWAPVTDADLAGYNIYRRQDNGEWAKVNTQLVQTPAYRDTTVSSGNKYFYSVSAVDLRGNESARSVEASESVP
jgi:hypothetical protein